MNRKIDLIIIFAFLFSFSFTVTFAQQNNAAPEVSTTPVNNEDVTILYDISIKSDRNKAGIEETYNGGIKTLFISGAQCRLRMVTLMRVQSLFFFPENSNGRNVILVKEFGKKKYKSYLTTKDWKYYNKKYDSVACAPTQDSLVILNYPCRKTIITLKDGRQITAYYTDSIKAVSGYVEPAFSCVPGTVLKYEYVSDKGTITFTAASISNDKIDRSVFTVPSKGYLIKKYCSTCGKTTKNANGAAEDID